MKTLHFEQVIHASPEKIWDVLLSDTSYPIWTKPFSADSRFIGTWEVGTKLLFIGTGPDGTQCGMVSMVDEHRKNEHLSIKHIGFYNNGVEDTTSPEVQKACPAYEKYTIVPTEDGCVLQIDLDTLDEYVDMFNYMWKSALVVVKMMSEMQVLPAVTVETSVTKPLDKVWEYFTLPEHIVHWNQAATDWHTTSAANDVRIGGHFSYYMAAKDGSAGFDFNGTYTDVCIPNCVAYTLEGGRRAVTFLNPEGDTVHLVTIFEPETENTPELQKQGWQAILDSFKQYVEKEVM